jgi:hypothetical protein
MPNHHNEECRAVQVARMFFQAATKLSEDNEDILPQVVRLLPCVAFLWMLTTDGWAGALGCL